jgi:hypothetical protein
MTSSHRQDAEPDILQAGGAGPRLSERWAAIPRRIRRVAGAGAAVVLLAALGGYALAFRPGPPPPPPPPWPSQSSDITYAGVVEGPDRTGRRFAFLLRAEATTSTPVTIEDIRQGYEALSLSVSPRLPITLTPGQPRRITVRITVRRCSGLPLDARLPFLDVTLRNKRAGQDVSEILGAAYADDLSRALRASCASPSTPTPRTP